MSTINKLKNVTLADINRMEQLLMSGDYPPHYRAFLDDLKKTAVLKPSSPWTIEDVDVFMTHAEAMMKHDWRDRHVDLVEFFRMHGYGPNGLPLESADEPETMEAMRAKFNAQLRHDPLKGIRELIEADKIPMPARPFLKNETRPIVPDGWLNYTGVDWANGAHLKRGFFARMKRWVGLK